MTPSRLSELPTPPSGKVGWPWTADVPLIPPNTSTWPRLTVVTPSFNQAAFLEETIRSVLLQGYPNLEYRIVDGGSTDGSVEIIQRYRPWLDDWVSEEDEGQSQALNKGLGRATGEVLTWLNSDDRFQPGALLGLVQAWQAHPYAGVIYGDFTEIDTEGQLLGRYRSPDFDVRRQMVRQLIPQPAALFRRAVWERVGPLRTDLHYQMDLDLWNRASIYFEIVHVPVLAADMRLHATSKTVGQATRFMAERQRYYDDFFRLPDLPSELRQLEREARAANFFSLGHAHLRAREYPDARWAFEQAWRLYPNRLKKLIIPLFWLDTRLKTRLGPRLFRLWRSASSSLPSAKG